jgi:hypothetical protein
MISFIENKNIDHNRWDRLISQSPNGLIYSYSWFLDLVCENWDALIEDDYRSVLPLPRRKKYGFEYIFQPFYTNQFGIISPAEVSTEKVNSFLQNIPKRFRYVDIMLNFQNRTTAPDYKITERKAQFLNLNSGYDAILKRYDTSLKRNLQKAQKNNLIVKAGVTAETVTEYFRKAKGNELGDFSEKDYKTLTRILTTASGSGNAFTLGAYSNSNELLAAAGFLKDGKRIIFLKGGSSPAGRAQSAMHLLIDYVIRQEQNKDMLFDFGGSNVPSVARFYKCFGAEDYLYLHVKRNLLPFYLRWLKK